MDRSEGAAAPTTKDLARAAGVSRATVDRVLNGRHGVKPATVARVNAAIDELGFVRNLSAANLAKSRRYRFLFVLPRSGDQFLAEILRHIREARTIFAGDMVRIGVERVDENDPHGIAAYLATLSADDLDGLAIMVPETPQVRDALARLEERGVRVLPFVADQSRMEGVGIDDRAAGRTAGLLLARFAASTGAILVVTETMQSRDSLERRLGFDAILAERAPGLNPLPSLETYGAEDRARRIIPAAIARTGDAIVGAYLLSSEPRIPLAILAEANLPETSVIVAHERTPCTEAALREGRLDAVIAQNPGHLVRSAIRKLRALADGRDIYDSQERIRIEILLPTNL